MRTRRFPDDDTSCGWVATLPPPPPARRLIGEVRVDCAVVGAGFSGLAAARRLAALRPAWRVVVLEAFRCALGTASGTALAELAVGVDSELLEDVRGLPALPWIPPEPFLGLGVRATLAYMAARGRPEA